jgi:transposase InsO family protein
VLDDERAKTTTGFLRRTAAWLASLDVQIERIMTDNGPAYCSHRFRAAVRELGPRLLYTRPYAPRTNGKAERFIRTALERWAYTRAYRTSRERTAALPAFLAWYNTLRKHGGIGQRTPQQRLIERMAVNNPSINHS